MTMPSDIPADIYQWASEFWDANLETEQVEMVARAYMAGQASQPVAFGLTPGQVDLLKFYRDFKDANGHMPSYDQAAKALGIVKSRVHTRLHQLEERGFVAILPGRARSITIVARH